MICVDFGKSQIYVGAARNLHYFRVKGVNGFHSIAETFTAAL